MDARTEQRIVARFLELEDGDTTTLADASRRLDPGTYVDHERFERERALLFRRAPVVVATTADLPRPGDSVTCESGGVPLVVVRGSDGVVRAFVNACRHRAHPVTLGAGHSGRRFVCPFHAWTYDTDDGHLAGRPRACGGFDDCDSDALGLIGVPCVEAHGLVIVRPEGDEPIDADAFLAGIGTQLAGFAVGAHHVYSRTDRVWACNWKLLVDTFLESYHVAFLHAASLGNQPGHRMNHEPFGDHLRIPVPAPSLYRQRELPEHARRLVGHGTVQHFLFPNALLNHVRDYLLLWRFEPLAVDRTRAVLTRYWPAPVTDEVRAELEPRFAWQATLTADEDYPASERIHAALASGRVPYTVLGRNEAALVRFHDAVDRVLAGGAR